MRWDLTPDPSPLRGGEITPHFTRCQMISNSCLHRDASEDCCHVIPDFIVSNADDGEAASGDDLVTLSVIVSTFVVNWAINLYYQPSGRTVEIRDEPVNDLLPAETQP